MYRPILVLCLLFNLSVLSAQIGLGAFYENFSVDESELILTDQNGEVVDGLIGKGFSGTVDYWFRLKNVRIEFLPTLAYSKTEQIEFDQEFIGVYESSSQHFFFNTNFYLFDFLGDCDCPTFSKSDPFFKKGFFVQLSPGISRFDFSASGSGVETEDFWSFSIGGGAGLDIGVTDLITVSPIARLRYYPNVTWLGTSNDVAPKAESSVLQTSFGLRVGLRLDYNNGRRY